jgi:microcin C transport system substrate-binding protein
MRYYTLILTIFFTLCNSSAFAEEKPSYGLAMHGKPKYTAQESHLEYANPDAPKGGDIKIAAIGSYDTLNPYSIKGQPPENMNLVYDRLMRRIWDEPFTMYPLIAKSIDVSDDRSEVTFHINPKARFHDNSPITANDVLYSFETLKSYGRPNMRRIYKLVDKVEVKSPHEIYFHFGEGYDRETVMILAMMPVISKQWWSAHDFDSTITKVPLLNGPYKIKKSDIGNKITYERVKDYWAADLFVNKGHYNFDTITYEYYRDDTVALESFNKGDLDLRREWNINKWSSGYSNLPGNYVRKETPHSRPERAHGFIFNLRRPVFQDINVRKALSLAFNDEWVSKNIFHDRFKRIQSFYPNSALDGSGKITEDTQSLMNEWKSDIPLIAFAETLKPNPNDKYRQKLRRAAALLDQAGWVIENGLRVNKDTKTPLTFEIIQSTPQEEKIALSYKQNLSRLGIVPTIRTLDTTTFQKRKTSYDYDMIMTYWQNSLSPGTEQMLYWSCAAAKQEAQFNFSGICNSALDHFSSSIANAKTYDELTSYAHIIDRILLSEHIMIPLFYKGNDYISFNQTIGSPDTIPTYGIVLETWWKNQNGN